MSDDYNLKNAVTWCINAIVANSGQFCFTTSRVYVQGGIRDQFMAKYKAALDERGKTIGDPDDQNTIMSPLVDSFQFKRVMGFIERGASQGTLLTGGDRVGDKGRFVALTVFTDVALNAGILRNEIFGSVSIVNTFKSEEVLEKANVLNPDSWADLFTQDINRAPRIAGEFDSTQAIINNASL